MNRIYEIEEGRPFWKLKPVQLLVTVIADRAGRRRRDHPRRVRAGHRGRRKRARASGEVAQTVWSILKWPVLAFIVVLIVAILYYATPNAKQPKFRWISLGALLAIVVLALATLAFGFYVAQLLQLRQDLRVARRASSSSCCGCGSRTSPCCSARSSTPSSSADVSCRPASPRRRTSSCRPATPARATKRPRRSRRTSRRVVASGNTTTRRNDSWTGSTTPATRFSRDRRRALLDYAQALEVGASATVDVPTLNDDGSSGRSEI